MAHLPKSGPRDGNDRSIEMADSQAYLILVYSTLKSKMAIYCPQGSGTLRQQLLMMH